MFADISPRDWSHALETTAEELLWEADVHEPPVDAFLVAMRLGLVVTEDPTLPTRAQFVRLAAGSEAEHVGVPTIVVGENDRFERRQFAVAHEIGEFAAVRLFDRLAINPQRVPQGSREQVANALAGRLLLPGRWFRKAGLECDWDLLELRERFWTASHELLARRMLDMPPSVVITVFDQGSVAWRRSNFGPTITLSACEHEAWSECHHWGQATSSADAELGVSIRCWPAHEPDWRREIMRTEVAMDDNW
jgi:Zn-dependent peptidase ImmA (M78 family)